LCLRPREKGHSKPDFHSVSGFNGGGTYLVMPFISQTSGTPRRPAAVKLQPPYPARTDTDELDDAAGATRASSRHRTVGAAPLGGSNRLLSVDELAVYLGVPKKTVYGCWRQWGLRGYRVGRYLRFRERHVEEWLRNQEA
jgi:excisionase family DNA binding protein